MGLGGGWGHKHTNTHVCVCNSCCLSRKLNARLHFFLPSHDFIIYISCKNALKDFLANSV